MERASRVVTITDWRKFKLLSIGYRIQRDTRPLNNKVHLPICTRPQINFNPFVDLHGGRASDDECAAGPPPGFWIASTPIRN